MVGMLVSTDLSKNVDNIKEAIGKLIEVLKSRHCHVKNLQSFADLTSE